MTVSCVVVIYNKNRPQWQVPVPLGLQTTGLRDGLMWPKRIRRVDTLNQYACLACTVSFVPFLVFRVSETTCLFAKMQNNSKKVRSWTRDHASCQGEEDRGEGKRKQRVYLLVLLVRERKIWLIRRRDVSTTWFNPWPSGCGDKLGPHPPWSYSTIPCEAVDDGVTFLIFLSVLLAFCFSPVRCSAPSQPHHRSLDHWDSTLPWHSPRLGVDAVVTTAKQHTPSSKV
ncbi:hypothetical protein N657DRAFT_179849 [Parathielavia appendiculata]|uniref:Uncharacterized protein n=1 Tax=Parathielavia appendiculata TaxID=2587402 RepID=A0AAN6Z6E5_9PEZI|nr:hypothetical protein N657DRAFT_179849 [Parathielavia appendiculata]